MPSFLERLFFWRDRSRFREALETVNTNQGNITHVGILADATQWDMEARQQAEEALISLLPRIPRLPYFSRLRADQGQKLYQYLSLHSPNVELTLTLLKSLENIADSSALDAVRALMDATADIETEQEIQQLASEVYPALQVAVKRSMQTLLIPASPPVLPPQDESLLLQSSFPPSVLASTARVGPDDDQTPVAHPSSGPDRTISTRPPPNTA
jgi:hypothetical protein